MPGHRQIDHTADLALELWGDSEEALLAEGARALVAIMTDGAALAADSDRTVELDSLDPEDRLVCWLGEIIYLGVTEGFLTTSCEIDLRENGLRARLRGKAGASGEIVTELKAVTYHDLALEQRDGQWRASVVIDV